MLSLQAGARAWRMAREREKEKREIKEREDREE